MQEVAMNSAAKLITPTQQDAQLAAEAFRRLSVYLDQPGDVKIEVGVEGTREHVALPHLIVPLLSRILNETASGHAVSVVPVDAELSTFEAADFLNVSRPYLISLLDQGKIPFNRVGSHRRVRLADVTEYKKKQLTASLAAMAELQAQAEELNLE
jgi:excisionase family DNA binding protein